MILRSRRAVLLSLACGLAALDLASTDLYAGKYEVLLRRSSICEIWSSAVSDAVSS